MLPINSKQDVEALGRNVREKVHSAKESQRKAQSIPIRIIFAARSKFEVSTYA